MDLTGVKAIAMQLIIAISGDSGSDVPKRLPPIEVLPAAEVQQRICNRACPIYAAYQPGKSVLLDERLDLADDLNARSILLHELVHYVQWRKYGRGPKDCKEWKVREMEAYLLQFRWLSAQPIGNRRLRVQRPDLTRVLCSR